MCTIDVKDAYYSGAVHGEHRKFRAFKWRDQLYNYTAFPNGLAPCPRVFTKLLKPAFHKLRASGFLSVAYIDDRRLLARSQSGAV